MAHTITDENFEELIVKSGKVAVVDFWAEWCGPCKRIAPIIDELAAEYGDRAIIGKVDVDSVTQVPAEFGIRNIPTVLFFKNGQLVDKHVGAAGKSTFVEKLEALL